MKQLLEDYQRRLKTINQMIEDLPTNCPDDPRVIRYQTKASCYKTFIAELEKIQRIDRIAS